MKLVAQGTLPRLEQGNLGSAVQGRRGRRLRPPRPSASAASCARPGPGVVNERAGRNRTGGVLDGGQGDRADRLARSDPRGGRGRGAQAARPQARRSRPRSASSPATRRRARSASSPRPRARRTRTYRVDVEIPNADGYIPDGITAEVTVPLTPVAGDARAALGADLLVGRRCSACARSTPPTRWRSFRCRWSRTSSSSCGSAASRKRARVIVAGPGLRARGPAGRSGRAAPRRRRPPRASSNGSSDTWAIPSTTPSTTRG